MSHKIDLEKVARDILPVEIFDVTYHCCCHASEYFSVWYIVDAVDFWLLDIVCRCCALHIYIIPYT